MAGLTSTQKEILDIMIEAREVGVVAEISHARRSKKVYLHSHLPDVIKIQHRTLDGLWEYLDQFESGGDVVYVLKQGN